VSPRAAPVSEDHTITPEAWREAQRELVALVVQVAAEQAAEVLQSIAADPSAPNADRWEAVAILADYTEPSPSKETAHDRSTQ
jgi:hypothetical protein